MIKLPIIGAAFAFASGVLAIDTAPIVDLGYAVHRATYNASGDYYSFSNIRFADPPTRFSKPQAPTTVDRTVNDGTTVRVCPNAYPWWVIEALAPQYGLTSQQLQAYLYSTAYDEDCLFLDVAVPRSVYDNCNSTNGSAVLVWIYGGGFTLGGKDDPQYNPSGLIFESQTGGQEGIIVIKINYRLGLFGWLGEGDGVTKNAGLYDQRLALDWVQKYVHLFGGDPNRVSVMGESAGGASIMHHITAYGGSEGPAPFKRAIPQSPGFEIAPDASIGYDLALEAASNLTGDSFNSVEQLNGLDSAILIEVNKIVVNASSYGTFTYGPVTDGSYVPEAPGALLAEGKFDHNVEVMAGHNQHEAATFITSISSDIEFRVTIGAILHGHASADTIDHIATVVYPDDLSGTYGYKTQTQRLETLVNEEGFICNTRYLATAFGNQTYNYEFTFPPAYHQQDLAYTFFSGDPTITSVPGTGWVWFGLAIDMQQRITRFVQSGDPNTKLSIPQWPKYGKDARILNFGILTTTSKDDAVSERCDYWQSGVWRN